MCALHAECVGRDEGCALLQCRYGWAKDMDSALKHYVEHMKIECNKQQPRCRRNNK